MSELTDRAAASAMKDAVIKTAAETAVKMESDSARDLVGVLECVEDVFEGLRKGIDDMYSRGSDTRANKTARIVQIRDSHRYEKMMLDMVTMFDAALTEAHRATFAATVAGVVGQLKNLSEVEEPETLN